MRAILVSWYNEYAWGGDVVAYLNRFTGEVIDKKQYNDLLEREILDHWYLLDADEQKEFKSFNGFRRYMLDKVDTDYIPLVQVIVEDDEDLEKYGEYIKLY